MLAIFSLLHKGPSWRLRLANVGFATAAKGKKALPDKNAKPAKQKLMKRQKEAASKEVHAGRRGGGDRATSFIQALFSANPSRSEAPDDEELTRRAVIAKSWSKWTMLKQHHMSFQEAQFIKSKIRALEELQRVSPVLAEKATEISYEPAPLTIKIAAETRPNVLPFE